MKANPTLRLFLVATGSSLIALSSVSAQVTWDANGATALQTDGAGVWLTAGQWWNGSTNVNWTSGDSAIFGNGGAGGAVTLASPTTVGSLEFNYFTGTYTLGTAGQALTLNSGITKNAGAGIVTFSALSPITLGAAQTFTNNSTTNLVIGALNLNGNALTFSGTGVTTFEGNALNVMSGAGGIIKNGTGALILDAGAPNPFHTFTGGIVVNGGAVRFQTAANVSGRGNVTLDGGYLGGRFGSSPTFTGGLGTGTTSIQILGGTSGFSGEGGTVSTFTIGTAGSVLKWGATGENGATGFFNPTVLVLGGDQGMNANAKGTLANAIDLNGTTRTITSLQTNGDGATTTGFTVTGAFSNSAGSAAGLTKTGPGAIILGAANTYDGATSIQGGSIILSAAAATINGTSALNLSGGGILRLVNTAQVNRFADGAAITVSAGGGITYENSAGANLNYTETLGSVALNGGLLNVNLATNQNNATNNSQTLTFGASGSGNLTQSGTGSVAFSAAGTGPQASGGDNMIVVTGSGTTAANEIIGSWATTGTTAALQTDYAVYNANYVTPANIAASAQSGWTTTTAATSNYTMSALASGTISGGTKNINSLRSTNNAVTVTASNPNIALASHTLAVGDVVTFSAATMPTNLTAGTPYYVVATGSGTIQVSATAGGGAITPGTTGTTVVAAGAIKVSSGNNLGTTGILNGSATTLNIVQVGGAGIVTLPTTTAGNLYINTGSGGITSAAPISNNTGALTLVKNGSGSLILSGVNNAYTGDTIINAGTLQVGISGINSQLNGGTYAGNIFIARGAALTFQGNASNTLSGDISGDGNLNLNRGTTTLSGNNTYTGKTSMTLVATNALGSTLNVSSFNSVVGGTASSSLGAPTTVANGTIDFGGGGIQQSAQINFTGATETTDRIINFQFNGNGANRTIDSSGAVGSLLKFTSAPISNGATGNNIVLQGTRNGEFSQGLPFAFTNLTKSGNGTWTLGGAVGSGTGVGLITVNAGTLALQQKSSIHGGLMTNWTAAKINVKSGATLALNVDSADAAGLSASSLNTLLGNISAGVTSATLGLQTGARIGLDTSTATGGSFTQGNAIANSTGSGGFNGAIGLTKLGTGTLVLDKTNSYTGATIVTAGTLIVDGDISTSVLTTVQTGATLGGVGSVGVTTINGILAPGNSIGSLIATGDVTWNDNNAWVFELGMGAGSLALADTTPGLSDLLNITGGNDFLKGTGSSFTFDFAGGGTAGWYKLVDWTGTTTFTGTDFLTQNLGSGLTGTFTVDSGTTALYLNVVPEPRAALLGALGLLMLLRRRR